MDESSGAPRLTPGVLRGVPLFAPLPDSELERLALKLSLRHFDAGELLIREGQVANRFYLLLDGQVEVLKALDTSDERLLAVRTGGAVGEMSLFAPGGQHTATVRARTPLQVLQMTRADFDDLLRRYPDLAYVMAETLSQRLTESEQLTIRDLRRKNRELQQAYDDLAAAQAQLVEKERLERELEVARRIQRSLLPRSLPDLPGYDIGALMAPMEAVGGDFYDCFQLGPGQWGIAIGDVSDHGVPAALFMAITVTLLRAEARRSTDPGEVLRSVARQLVLVNDADMFVTVLYGVLDVSRREFKFARAGHERPVLLAADGGSVDVARARGQLLGHAAEPVLDEQRLALPDPGWLLLYSDGVNESSDDHGALFGSDGLSDVVRQSLHLPSQALCRAVLDSVAAHRCGGPQQDDITVLAVRVQPEAR